MTKDIETIFLVEGDHDAHVLKSLFRHYNIKHVLEKDLKDREYSDNDGIVIKTKGSVEKLLKSLLGHFDESGIQTVGIMVDADDKIERRWREICKILEQIGYNSIPAAPDHNGTIIDRIIRPDSSDLPRVGVWLMPNNTLPGMLEDFIRFLVPNPITDELWLLSEESVQKANSISPPKGKEAKRLIHTWLAWQEDPGTPLGWAITKHYLDPTVPEAQILIDWVNRLFNTNAVL
jgi:hypothetical protein